MEELLLANGIKIPATGYGTGIIDGYLYYGDEQYNRTKYYLKNAMMNRKQFNADISLNKNIKVAMEHGLNMFDTSRAYAGSERRLGRALGKYKRDEYFVVTKMSNYDQMHSTAREALLTSLRELGMEYVDLYLIHWPVDGLWVRNWLQLEELYKEGLCKAIGVCNCNIHHLKELEKSATIMPMVNQFECHPLFTQMALREYCNQKKIQIMAYTPTGRMDERLKKTVLVPLAQKYNKSMAQIIMKWHRQIGNIPIVNSANAQHIIDNVSIDDFMLSNDEVQNIERININSRLRYDPDNCDFTQL